MASRFSALPISGGLRGGDSGSRLAMIGLVAAALLTIAIGWWAFGGGLFGVALAMFGIFGLVAFAAIGRRTPVSEAVDGPDWALLHAAFADGFDATAITDRDGRLLCASGSYENLFGAAMRPADARFADDGVERLAQGLRAAWRDGRSEVPDLIIDGEHVQALLRRGGWREDHIIWRFRRAAPLDPMGFVRGFLASDGGDRLGEAGVMLALVDEAGKLLAANPVFVHRALAGADDRLVGTGLADLLVTAEDGSVRLAADSEDAPPIRVVPVPLGEDAAQGPSAFLLLDEDPEVVSAAAARGAATAHLHSLLAMLPLGLALVERDGRFLFMNDAFGRAAGVTPEDTIVYPSDLVSDEDKPIVSDAVHRFAAGRALPGDLAIRLKHRPDEPVALTIANAKGLGEAAVLLSLKDNSEESKLKRQVAQATKMQAVGQLAGGVAHDFNNILTAIIGHCDLMMMRHVPGDIDYDDIQQIKQNSDRAAALTRQLLAFSRQQTLRPQILQLPDVISEVSNLLRRLLGETVRLEVKHGRNLGLVRADPGQLEQVIVNLAVNARDAMPQGGTLTLQTYPVTPADVRKMRSDILPIAAYTALKVSDTGCGIPTDLLGKIFEPFFTTKEVGKGTGLGLSTVYGIVKQTDGFIFADSEIGHGTSFTIYLPVHAAAEPVAQTQPTRVETGDLWGSGTILLVEDEAMVRAVAERALSRQGYTVLTANNGEEALELLEGEEGATIDLLISDVVMPMMDGPTLVRAARELFPDLKIIFMSGYAEEQLRKSIDVDRVAFLSKPFSVQQLGAAARDALVSVPA